MTTRSRVLVVDEDLARASTPADALSTADRDVEVVHDADDPLTILGNETVACIVSERSLGDRRSRPPGDRPWRPRRPPLRVLYRRRRRSVRRTRHRRGRRRVRPP